MKKIFACILVLILAVSAFSVFAACKPPVLPDFEIPEGGYDGSDVTIKFYSSMGQSYGNLVDAALVKFNQMFPNITVDHQRGGDYDSNRDLIRNLLRTTEPPNVAFCYSDHVALYNTGNAVVPLDDLINSKITITTDEDEEMILGLTDAEKADYIEAYYNEGKSFGDGKMYMLPFAKSTELLYYNETKFNEWGLDIPDHWFATDGKEGLATSDKTSMEYALAFIKDKDPMCSPLGVDSGANWLITLFEQFETGYTKSTGDHYLFDNEDNYEILKTLQRWYQKNWFVTRKLIGSYTSEYFKSPTNKDGKKTYMSIGSSAGAAKQVPDLIGTERPFTVGVTMIPQKNANTPIADCKVISQGPNVCIFKSANPQEVVASWLLVKYLTTNAEFEARYGAEAGYLPVIQSVNNLKGYADMIANANTTDNMAGMAAKRCIEYKDAFFVSPAFEGSSKARDQMEILLNDCTLIQSEDDATITSEIKKIFKRILDECKY